MLVEYKMLMLINVGQGQINRQTDLLIKAPSQTLQIYELQTTTNNLFKFFERNVTSF